MKKDLTKKQKDTMAKHKVHHTAKHMKVMKDAMLEEVEEVEETKEPE
jgi:hypothetical protein